MHGPELTTTEFDFGWPHHSAAQCSNFPQLRQLPETPIPRLSSLLGGVVPAIRHLSQPSNSSGWLLQRLVHLSGSWCASSAAPCSAPHSPFIAWAAALYSPKTSLNTNASRTANTTPICR